MNETIDGLPRGHKVPRSSEGTIAYMRERLDWVRARSHTRMVYVDGPALERLCDDAERLMKYNTWLRSELESDDSAPF